MSINQQRQLFLGAKDPEMDRIDEILRENKQPFIYATKDGMRVHAANAYEADAVSAMKTKGKSNIFVECRAENVSVGGVIDHHRPGDFGYAKEPRRYWEASSLGQVCNLLNIEPTQKDFTLAAMDHCFNAVIQGKCPGVTPEDVLKIKISEISKSTRVSTDKVQNEINRFIIIIENAELVTVDSQEVCDIKEVLGIGYSLSYLSAQVAASVKGRAVFCRIRDEEGGPVRIHLCGDVQEKTAEYFKNIWGPANGLVKIYGVPSRGYAGGTIVK